MSVVTRSAAQDLRPLTPARRHNAEHLTFSTPSANLYEENEHSLWSSSFTSQHGPCEVGLLPRRVLIPSQPTPRAPTQKVSKSRAVEAGGASLRRSHLQQLCRCHGRPMRYVAACACHGKRVMDGRRELGVLRWVSGGCR